MLVLSRKKDQGIVIRVGEEIVRVVCVDIRGDKCRYGIDAARHVQIDRDEIYDAKQRDRSRQEALAHEQSAAAAGAEIYEHEKAAGNIDLPPRKKAV